MVEELTLYLLRTSLEEIQLHGEMKVPIISW